MTVLEFDAHDQADITYARRRPRRRIRPRFAGPIAVIGLGLLIAALVLGGMVGAWIAGDMDGATLLDHLVVIACMFAAMAYITGREWLSERRRERENAERLATVMIWHADRADENRQILAAVKGLSAAKTCDCYSELGELRQRVATQGGTLAAVEHQISRAVAGTFNPDTTAAIHSLNRELNGRRPL